MERPAGWGQKQSNRIFDGSSIRRTEQADAEARRRSTQQVEVVGREDVSKAQALEARVAELSAEVTRLKRQSAKAAEASSKQVAELKTQTDKQMVEKKFLTTNVSFCRSENSRMRERVEGLEKAARIGNAQRSPRKVSTSPFAFVTMAYDAPGSWDYMWAVLPLARALQTHSSYPLVVLTNSTTLPDGSTEIGQALQKLNAQVLPLYKVDLEQDITDGGTYPTWAAALWKLQIWTLTQFEKVMWLDSDALVTRSLDWIFRLDGMWSQRDDWFCKMQQPMVCSGLLLAYPSSEDFRGLLAHAATRPKWEHGDQQIISSYFNVVKKTPVNLLADNDATFGQCLGKTPQSYRNKDGTSVPGVWDAPAFVHKSGGYGGTNDEFSNICFSHVVWRQYYQIGSRTINACHMHPFGPYFRVLFCEALRTLDLRVPEALAFCDDGCWYRGQATSEDIGQVDSGRWCRPVEASIGDATGVGAPVFLDPPLQDLIP